MKYCESCKKEFPDSRVFCSGCGNRLKCATNRPNSMSVDHTYHVNFIWHKSPVWSFHSILISVDRQAPPIELKNGNSISMSLPSGLHHFSFCAKGFKIGVEFKYSLNGHMNFICKPSSDAIALGVLSSKPSVTVIQEPVSY